MFFCYFPCSEWFRGQCLIGCRLENGLSWVQFHQILGVVAGPVQPELLLRTWVCELHREFLFSSPPASFLTTNCRMTVNYLLRTASAESKQSKNSSTEIQGFKSWVKGRKQKNNNKGKVSLINGERISQDSTIYKHRSYRPLYHNKSAHQ